MAKLSTEDLLDAFKELTLLELSEFVKAFEETFDVTAAAPVAVAAAPGAAAGAPAEAAEEQSEFDVILEAAGDKKIGVIKGGVFEGKAITAAEVAKIADLESRDVLLAKLAGAMKANLSKAAALFQAPLSQAVRTVAALQDKREKEDAAA